jgi:hypothetical protein
MHMLDLQHVDRELQHAQVVGVLRRGEVGDVAVHEQLARIQADDLVGRHAAVAAADPQIFGALLALQPLEEAGVGLGLAGDQARLLALQVIKHLAVPAGASG